MDVFNTAHVEENEIVKANDFEFAFQNLVTNVAKATQMFLEANQDFVINGKVLPNTTPDMFVKISPIFGVCKSEGIPFGNVDEESLSVGFAESTSGRVDIIEVKGEWEEYDEQQRAFNDPDTDTQTYQYVNTKNRLIPVYRIVNGTEGSNVAPNVEEGWVKLAEVVIRANSTQITESDIKNITSDVAGLANTGWTNDTTATFNVGYISDVNERFRVQHNADGTHAQDSINSDSLNIGVNTKQINSSILPIGGAVSLDTQTISNTDSILSVITKIVTMLNSLYQSYLKFGSYGFKGIMKISSALVDGSETVLKNPVSISADGNGNATVKIGETTCLTIDSSGKLSTNGYAASSNNNLVTKAVTEALSSTITNNYNDLSGQISDLRATLNGVKEFANDILSRYTLSDAVIAAVSTENVTLSGLQTIDGKSLIAGDFVLLKDQDDKAENGVWEVQTGAWNRASGYDVASALRNKLFTTINGNVNKGKIFYSPELFDPFIIDETEIIFKESNLAIRKVSNKVVMRDSNGKAYLDIEGNAATATKLETARKVYVKLATASTAETKDFSGDTEIPVDGILNVANGGTGKATHTANSILAGDGANAVKNIPTVSGALFATSDDGAAQFGTLPIAQGGTGATSSTNARIKLGIGYGTCTASATTAAKTATITGFTIEEGCRIAIKFTNANTAASPTLNINGTGDKNIYLNGNAKRPSGGNYVTWGAEEIVEFIYNGSAWIMQKAINMTLSGTTLYVEC